MLMSTVNLKYESIQLKRNKVANFSFKEDIKL